MDKPKRRKLIKGSIYLQYDKGYNHSHSEWEAYHKEVIKELLEALKNLLDLCNLEDEHGRLVIKESAKNTAKQAIAKAEGI